MEVVFIPVKYKKPLSNEFMEKIAEVSCEKVGLFTTIQYIDQLNQLEEFLKKKGKKVFIGEPTYRAVKKGQVLGCDVTSPLSISKNVDCYIYLGSGYFHSIALSLELDKPIFQANPFTGVVNKVNEKEVERYKKLRKETIAKAKKANVYGILVCTKQGQYFPQIAKEVKKKLEAKGKKAYIFMFETLSPESLLDFQDIEAWVNTACPRIAIDDIERFDRPIVNPGDL
ncbi:MAG: diphthamide biosynthesis enzyme Dph2 [Nanoarchaeota archaeon]|nr:diphthamide biosynthesis enzyme Dph2 [Nanoarchaeota archaeon]